MYIKIDEKIVKIHVLSEKEKVLYFYELCQMAKRNPWRGIEFQKAKEVLEELEDVPFYAEMKQDFEQLTRYREGEVLNPNNEPKVTNWASAMARHYKKINGL